MNRIKVGVNGYGAIGKRVADAVRVQKDMRLVGAAKMRPDWSAKLATKNGIRLFAAKPEANHLFKEAGVDTEGDINDLLSEVDVIVDCSPKNIGAENKVRYDKLSVNAIFQGGEKASVAEVSFNASCNFEEAIRQERIRVVSCNTTGLCRSLNIVNRLCGVKIAHANIIRRSVDPHECKTGPINAIIPTPTQVSSHHGPDLRTILHDVTVLSSVFTVPSTLMHVHSIMVETKSRVDVPELLSGFDTARRITTINETDGFTSTAHIMEMCRDKGTKRGDSYDVFVWRGSFSAPDEMRMSFIQAIPQESIVIPENIDAIRAMFDCCTKEESMKRTDSVLKALE